MLTHTLSLTHTHIQHLLYPSIQWIEIRPFDRHRLFPYLATVINAAVNKGVVQVLFIPPGTNHDGASTLTARLLHGIADSTIFTSTIHNVVLPALIFHEIMSRLTATGQ